MIVRVLIGAFAVSVFALSTPAIAAGDGAQPGRSQTAAMWYSIAHPGLGEWYLKGWGSFDRNCPKKKFYLGFIPLYGWPGYLQVISAIDARHGRTGDNLSPGAD